MPAIKVLRHGQVTLPKELREELHIDEGDILEAEISNDQIVLKPKVLIDKTKAWKRLSAVMERVGRRHENMSEEIIERDVLEAIAAVRKQEEKSHAPTKTKSRA